MTETIEDLAREQLKEKLMKAKITAMASVLKREEEVEHRYQKGLETIKHDKEAIEDAKTLSDVPGYRDYE